LLLLLLLLQLLLLLFGALSLAFHALFAPEQLLHVGPAGGGALLEGGWPAQQNGKRINFKGVCETWLSKLREQ
jgi:hypothetical protein